MNIKTWIKSIAVIAIGVVLEIILFKHGYGKVAILIFALTIIVGTILVVNSCFSKKIKILSRLLTFALIILMAGGPAVTTVIMFTQKYTAYKGVAFPGTLLVGSILLFCICILNRKSVITEAHP